MRECKFVLCMRSAEAVRHKIGNGWAAFPSQTVIQVSAKGDDGDGVGRRRKAVESVLERVRAEHIPKVYLIPLPRLGLVLICWMRGARRRCRASGRRMYEGSRMAGSGRECRIAVRLDPVHAFRHISKCWEGS